MLSLSRNILTPAEEGNLSGLITGSRKLAHNAGSELVLASRDVQVGLTLDDRGEVRAINAVHGDSEAFWISNIEKDNRAVLLGLAKDSCQHNSLVPLRTYFQNELDDSLAFNVTLPSLISDVKNRLSGAVDSQQFASISFGTRDEFVSHVRSIACVSMDEALYFASPSKEERLGISEISASRIVGTQGDTSWLLDIDVKPDYLYEMAKSIQQGALPVHNPSHEIDLVELEGVFWVRTNGRHRTACVKAMDSGDLTVRGNVSSVTELEVVVWNRADYEEILERQRRGLWSGEVKHPVQRGGHTELFAAWTVQAFAGAWVFAKELPSLESV